MSFRDRYLELFERVGIRPAPADGCPESEVQAAEARLGVVVPAALREYYLLCGRHPLNSAYNELLSPERLEWSGDHLVFMEENQVVVYWGLSRGALSTPDPAVLQAPNAEVLEWFPESERLSGFLSVMLCWQAASGGLPFCGVALGVAPTLAIPEAWPELGTLHELRVLAAPDAFVCVTTEGEELQVNAGAATEEAFTRVGEALGLSWDWSSLEEI